MHLLFIALSNRLGKRQLVSACLPYYSRPVNNLDSLSIIALLSQKQ